MEPRRLGRPVRPLDRSGSRAVAGLLVLALAVVLGAGAAEAATTAAPTVTLSVSPSSPTTYGSPVTLTATASPGTTAGTVFFYDGWHHLDNGGVRASGGSATLTVPGLGLGAHALSAELVADVPGTWAVANSATLPLTVLSATTTTLTVSPADPAAGQPVSLVGAVSATAPGAGVPAGAVQLVSDTLGVLATLPLDGSGRATYTWLPPATGVINLAAVYLPAPGSLFAGSRSATVVQATRYATTTALTVSPSTVSVPTTPVTLSATVSPTGRLYGSVDFYDGAVKVGTAGWSPSLLRARLTLTSSTVGDHAYHAVFRPAAASWAGSTSPVVTHAVRWATTTSLVVTGARADSFGGWVLVQVSVTPPLPGFLTVTAHFADGTASSGDFHSTTGVLDTSVFAVDVAMTITATFTPDAPFSASYSPSTSPPVTATG